ncbi:trypsin delta-like [Anopheles albimanus]|uniref:trypsin delta-like n=1 Tax=Anopheles albimanus TaxID=7167 RepID=UPI001641165E|nr:trypsin delta-like [Anopheles albimanus]
MKQSVKFTLLVVLFSAYSVQAQDEEPSNPDGDADTFDLTDEITGNSNGQSDPQRAGRIVGGQGVVIADYPYTVSIIVSKIIQTRPFVIMRSEYVTGVIISNTQVLTAASIFDIPPSMIQIRAGSTNIISGGSTFTDVTYKLHSLYNNVTGENDVAIITMNRTFAGLTNVKPIAVETSVLEASSQNPINCFIVGWGYESSNGISPTMKRANYTLSTDAVCAATLNRAVPSSVQCATSVSGHGCDLDQGSPVVCNNKLYGIFKTVSSCSYDTNQTYTHPFAVIPARSIYNFVVPRKSYIVCP